MSEERSEPLFDSPMVDPLALAQAEEEAAWSEYHAAKDADPEVRDRWRLAIANLELTQRDMADGQ